MLSGGPPGEVLIAKRFASKRDTLFAAMRSRLDATLKAFPALKKQRLCIDEFITTFQAVHPEDKLNEENWSMRMQDVYEEIEGVNSGFWPSLVGGPGGDNGWWLTMMQEQVHGDTNGWQKIQEGESAILTIRFVFNRCPCSRILPPNGRFGPMAKS